MSLKHRLRSGSVSGRLVPQGEGCSGICTVRAGPRTAVQLGWHSGGDEMITVLGSIGMDLLFSLPHLPAVGETVLTPACTTSMGGKGANQAVAAARDGGRVRFVGSAGADRFGNEVRSLLRAEGIDLTGFATVDAPTC